MGSSSKKRGSSSIPTEGTYLADPIIEYRAQTGAYPSNAELWWAYRRPLEVGTDRPPKNYLQVFDPSLRLQFSTGNSPAPKGHYILDAFKKDRSGVSNVRAIDVETSGFARPTCVAFYAGRVFYSGVNVAGYNTKIYYTQILERPEQVQYCFQSLDPTHEDLRDLLPSDGGVVSIPEVTEVYHIQVMGPALYVFARNGVWQLAGSEGTGFRANDFAVSKVSSTPAISPLSFVTVEGAPLWWNRTGIFTIAANELGSGRVQSLSEETIKTFFDNIPVESKFYAKGSYDPLRQRVQWLYQKDEDKNPRVYNAILNLDTRTGAFYPYSIEGEEAAQPVGIFTAEGYSITQTLEMVFVDAEEVYVDDEEVAVLVEEREMVQARTLYITNILEQTPPETPPDAP